MNEIKLIDRVEDMQLNKKSLNKKEVGKRIKQIIDGRHSSLSIAELGNRLVKKDGYSVPKSTVNSWIRGLSLPPVYIGEQLASLGNTTVEWIYYGEILPKGMLTEVMKKEMGKRIKEIRLAEGWTLEVFGKLVRNAPQELVESWESGMQVPNRERLEVISLLSKRMSEKSVDWILYGDIDEQFKKYVCEIFSEFDAKLHLINEKFYMDLWKKVCKNEISFENENEILTAAIQIKPSLLNDKKIKVSLI
ncbi:helix-turn-helix domain-containing protein [Bacillus cereus]|nr:helix-turn-helix transcriptional regulator [Bacillus cereus]